MQIGIISIFPEMFRSITEYGITSKAIKKGLLDIKIWNPRNFALDKNHTIDDRPYGGGPGMLMKMYPLREAINAAKFFFGKNVKVIYLSPQGRKLNQNSINELLKNHTELILLCGRYKGIDERLIQIEVNEEWSIGDYVLSGGELPAMILIDSISRFIPGVLGNKNSAEEDSFFNGLLDCPHYTRPSVLEGIQVPKVLLSGNHNYIHRWRMKQSLGITWVKKPELLKLLALTEDQKKLLEEFKTEKKFYNKKIK